MRMFRPLQPQEIECRISEFGPEGNWLTLLLYKTARTDAKLLDEVVGPFSWANEYRVIDGKMYCGIGIKGTEGEWVWKWNVGTESNTEAEKGEASDALKRAGFVWGIGTELYSAPRIYIRSGDCEIKKNSKGKWVCYDGFEVTKIRYGEQEEIEGLEIANKKSGRVCYTFSGKKEIAAPPAPAAPKRYFCRKCKKEVDPETATYSMEACEGMVLCAEHQKAYFMYKMRQAEGGQQ